jgi:citrate/tricarballylate utilization protein
VLRLKYLDGGHGDGCHNEDDEYTLKRRRFHHLTFYGFMLCFAATGLATVYHYVFDLPAPYELPSLPKILGALGGVSLMTGTAGLWMLNRARHPLHGDVKQSPWTSASSPCCSWWPPAVWRYGWAAPRRRWHCCCACTWAP